MLSGWNVSSNEMHSTKQQGGTQALAVTLTFRRELEIARFDLHSHSDGVCAAEKSMQDIELYAEVAHV